MAAGVGLSQPGIFPGGSMRSMWSGGARQGSLQFVWQVCESGRI